MTRSLDHGSLATAIRKRGAKTPPPSVAPSMEQRTVINCIEAYFARYGWPKSGSGILVSLSGGPDSVAALYALTILSRDHQWEVAAAHVNYRLRGRESDQDEALSRELCRQWGIHFHCSRRRLASHPPESNVQAWARDLRYRFLDRIADRHGYDWIAVGHHLGDRAETVAAAVLDAAGTFALSGIPPVRGRIIRPLFDCSPEAIREFLRASRIPYRIDRSNSTMSYQRNRIRHQTIPAWMAANPSIVGGLARLGEQLWRQNSYLEKQAVLKLQKAVIEESAQRITLDAGRLSRFDRSLDPFVLRELIRRLQLCMVPTPSTVERFFQLRRSHGSGRVEQGKFIIEWSKGQVAACARSGLGRVPKSAPLRPDNAAANTPNWEIKTDVVEEAPKEQFDDCRQVFLDLGKVHQPVKLRHLQAGDRYRPLGLGGTKKLLDLLADHRIPVFQRSQIPVLIDQEGILWPVGQPIADRAKVTRRTRHILRVVVQPL